MSPGQKKQLQTKENGDKNAKCSLAQSQKAVYAKDAKKS